MNGERILIVRLAALGDAVMTSVLLSRIRAELPGAHVTWLCGSALRPVVELFDVDAVVAVDIDRLFRGGRAARLSALIMAARSVGFGASFDRVLIGHADRRYRTLVPLARRGRIRMLERDVDERMNPIPGRYLGDECARLLDEAGHRGPITLRFPPADVRPKLAGRPTTAEGSLVVLVPGGARNVLREDAVKRWPAESYRAVADALISRGYDVALVGDQHDTWVRQYFEGCAVRDRIGRDSLVETLTLMRDASLVVTHDTGPMHLARLVRAPLLSLFGPTSPTQFVTDDDPGVTVLWGGAHLPCRPCYNGREFAACADNLCMQSISAEEVTRVALTLLKHSSVDARVAAGSIR